MADVSCHRIPPEREITTKEWQDGQRAGPRSHLGLGGTRLLVNGCWGFASTDDLSSDSLAGDRESGAVEIALAPSGEAKKADVLLAPEEKIVEQLGPPRCRLTPFFHLRGAESRSAAARPIAEARAVPGITLVEASLHLRRNPPTVPEHGKVRSSTRPASITGAGH